ncbi:hypothetical protein [Tomitella fengzijianii]|uniref:Uncharacterized protein n=1 Tax=Tomitella fengzijianii TaxID=2597660 RepID=A0A516X0R6_9ACTN|nr:hypothetical protein [Tomitella fengzijianii]QDQ96684.1 hypothetical protein FO059_04145 [Tomitella fengzijianii]
MMPAWTEAGGADPDVVPEGADARARLLHSAAFGDGPASIAGRIGDGAAPPVDGPRRGLPAARTPRELWWRAVAHSGAGFYARAGSDLAVLTAAGAGAGWDALAASTAASLLRQMGCHERAAVLDGRALARLAGAGPAAAGPVAGHARADALTGLAADRLGRGDWRTAQRLLTRCRALLEPEGPRKARGACAAPRLLLRVHWVTAETAMTAGDAASAVAAARAAQEMLDAGAFPSERHRVKTLLVAAAAEAVAGRPVPAAGMASRAHAAARSAGLVPLRWAAAMLLAGVTENPTAATAESDVRACHDVLAVRGGDDPRLMRGGL